MAEGVQRGPERSRARSLRRQRTLDGEDRSVTIPLGRKVAVTGGFLVFPLLPFPSRPNQPCRHPSIRTLSERLLRSVQVGCSRFSRCCHLYIDLGSISKMKAGPGDRRSHRNSALGFCLPSSECYSKVKMSHVCGTGGQRLSPMP